VPEMKQLRKDGISKRAIAKQLRVSRTSVGRPQWLAPGENASPCSTTLIARDSWERGDNP
jgi:hypothetical protein